MSDRLHRTDCIHTKLHGSRPTAARRSGRSRRCHRRDWRIAVALANQAPLLTDNKKHLPEQGLELWPLPAHGDTG